MKRATAEAMISDTLHVFGKDIPKYLGLFFLYAALTTALTLVVTTLALGYPAGTVTPSPNFTTGINMDAVVRLVLLTLLVSIIGSVIGSILYATLTYYAFHRYRNERVTLGEAFGQGVKRFLSVLGASLVLALIVAGFLILPLGLVLAGAFSLDLCLIGTGGLLLLVLLPIAIYIYIGLALYAPTIMIEGKTAVGSLRRSWELTRERRWALFLALLVVVLLSAVVSAIVAVPFTLSLNAYVSAIGTIISTTITGSWTIIFAVVAYHLIVSESPYGARPEPDFAPAQDTSGNVVTAHKRRKF